MLERGEEWTVGVGTRAHSLEHDTCKLVEEKTMRQQCSRYFMIGQDLYQRDYSRSLLKCVTEEQAEYVLKEIHEGVCGNHSCA